MKPIYFYFIQQKLNSFKKDFYELQKFESSIYYDSKDKKFKENITSLINEFKNLILKLENIIKNRD